MAMKARVQGNRIDILFDENGREVIQLKEIEDFIRDFYICLLGTIGSSLVHIDVPIVKRGVQLKEEAYKTRMHQAWMA